MASVSPPALVRLLRVSSAFLASAAFPGRDLRGLPEMGSECRKRLSCQIVFHRLLRSPLMDHSCLFVANVKHARRHSKPNVRSLGRMTPMAAEEFGRPTAARGATTSRTSPSGSLGTQLICITGALGLREVEPWPSNTNLRRGPSAATSESLSAYARPVPADDGRSPTSDLDRGGSARRSRSTRKTTSRKPALDGRHRDRDLRLPAPALRTRRGAPALPRLRGRPDRRAVRSDLDRGSRILGAARGQRASRSNAPVVRGTVRASTASSSRSFANEGLSRGSKVDGEQHLLDEAPALDKKVQAHDRGPWSTGS